MAWLAFIVLTFLAVGALGTRSRRRRHRRPATDVDVRPAESDYEWEEMGLAQLLVAGWLDRREYQSRMADLAARDALRLPLVVPPEPGSTA